MTGPRHPDEHIQALERDLASAHQYADEQVKRIDALLAQVERLEKLDIPDLKIELTGAREENERLNKLFSDVKDSLREWREPLEADNESLRAQVDALTCAREVHVLIRERNRAVMAALVDVLNWVENESPDVAASFRARHGMGMKP
jgi:septal ring factor EnvC (AmiA/AmiB activator)